MMQHIQQPRPQVPGLQPGQTLSGTAPGQPAQQQVPTLIRPTVPAKQPAAAVKSAELVPALKRQKKRKLPEKAASDRVVPELPQSALFTQAADLERQLDAAMASQRAYVTALVGGQKRVPKKLRLMLQSRHFHQEPRSGTGSAADPPSWEFEISGKVIDVAEAEGAAAAAAPSAAAQPATGVTAAPLVSKGPPMTSCLRRLTIRLDPQLYPHDGVITWTKALHEGPHKEKFSVRRRGTQDVAVQVEVDAEYAPEQFTLHPPLADLVGLQHGTRQRILHALWHYIHSNKLQMPNQADLVTCDARLANLLGDKVVKLASLSERIGPMLTRVPTPVLEYTIRTQGKARRECFDIDIEMPLRPGEDRAPPAAHDPEIDVLDRKIAGLLRKIEETSRRRNFFLAFSQSPVDFINALIASQARDLRCALAADAGGPGSAGAPQAMRRSELFHGRWVEDAVLRYLGRRIASGS
ncbi:SWI/SNF-related matrix-associated actin-dependent regulator [Coccomyxa sp. Obi]|nr:SWI/SNF-related matrix-associated actin-dependent regulator [Coccomyxa sp. Obi]